MKTNRGVVSAAQRLSSVFLCSVLIWSASAPAMAAAGRVVSVPAASNVPVVPSIPAMNVGLPSSAVDPRAELMGSASPAAISVGLLGAASPLATSANHPAAAAFLSVLAEAAGSESSLQSAGASRDLGAAKQTQDALYDRSRGQGAQAPLEVSGNDWTTAPPALPMASLKPLWHVAQAPSAPELKQRARAASIEDPIKESEAAATEALSPVSVPEAIKDITTDEDAAGYGQRQRFEAPGSRRAVLTKEGFAWIDSEGRVVVYHRAGRHAEAYVPPGGAKAEQLAASQDGSLLYVHAGETLQRWDVAGNVASVVRDPKLLAGGVLELNAVRSADGRGTGVDARTPTGHLFWEAGSLSASPSGSEEIEAHAGVAPTLRAAGDGYYLEAKPTGTRLWARELGESEATVVDMGSLPLELRAVTVLADNKTAIGLTRAGLVEWDLQKRRYREFPVTGLEEAVTGPASLDVSEDGRRAAITAGGHVFYVDLGAAPKDIDSEEAEVRRWAEENPMYIKGNLLYIGEFTFPVKPVYKMPAPETGWQKFVRWIKGEPAPTAQRVPPVSPDQWQALNLPANKWALYQTLKAFTLGQNTLYIGETGGGKTWMSSMIAKLIGRKLYTVSFTEYTKNQDLLFSRTFGEEAAGKTGKTLETVLQWLSDPEGGILLLDEMHKPLEGIAALNNILQNLTYHMGGKDIVGSRQTHFVIGTMNPVKPPYKGEPPSGELSSRFGTTIQVNYLPPSEEAALLSIFFPDIDARLSRTLVSIARELRKVYPDVLPLPISSRTLLYVAEHIAKYPNDDRVKIFKSTYNPGTIVEDPSIIEAIEKALKAHDLSAGKKKA